MARSTGRASAGEPPPRPPRSSTTSPSRTRRSTSASAASSFSSGWGRRSTSRPRRAPRCRSEMTSVRTAARTVLDRDPPEREPAVELGLDRELRADDSLDLQLAFRVALLVAARRHERVPRAPLVVVDEVQRLGGAVVEGEDGAQNPVLVAAYGQCVADRVDADREILEVRVAEDHPAVAELVIVGVDAGAGLLPG